MVVNYEDNLNCVGLYILDRTLGIGATGKVKLAKHSKTGEKVDVAEKKVAFFKTGKLLRDRLNRN